MDATEALKTFLFNALVKTRRQRLINFAAKPKTQSKFLDAIYHDLEDCFDNSKRVDALPDSVVSMPGYKFQPPESFGHPIASLGDYYRGSAESYLVVTIDGKFGIYGPETFIDSRAFYAI